MNPLNSNPKARKFAYLVQWFANLVLGVVSVVLVSQDQNPQWWIVTQAVANFLWTYLGLTAQGNTNTDTDIDEDIDDLEGVEGL